MSRRDWDGAALASKGNTSRSGLPGPDGIAYLTPRQAEVLNLAAQGLSNKQIAICLALSVRTIEDRFAEMRHRTGIRTRSELLARATAAGLVQPRSGPVRKPVTTARPRTRRGPGAENQPFSDAPRPDGVAAHDAPPGALVGYARVDPAGQGLDRQIQALTKAGCVRIFVDKLSNETAAHPELDACLHCLHPGDILVVPSLRQMAGTLPELITLVASVGRSGLGFRSLQEALDTTVSGGRLVFHVFAALTELAQGGHGGVQTTSRRGRPPAMTAEQIRYARVLLTQRDNTVSSVARLLGVNRSTIYRYLPELRGRGGTR